MEVTFTGWVGGSETDNRVISVQLNLTGTATGTELGKNLGSTVCLFSNAKPGVKQFSNDGCRKLGIKEDNLIDIADKCVRKW